jgi:rSAM/selenodomain-associated transferase 1
MKGGDVLILMCKAPIPGKVKTRLCPPLSPRRAAELYTALLEDAAEETMSLRGVRRYLFFSPPESKAFFSSVLFSGFSLLEQAGGDLGERMAHAISEVFAVGARRAVMIGADCPALTAGRIRSAFAELSRGADAVFGPAEDGGVYLVGLSAPAPFMFRGIEWSTPAVLQSMLTRCRNACMAYALLPAESDVDTPEDLAALREWLRARSRPPCPRTRGWLKACRRPSSPRGCAS